MSRAALLIPLDPARIPFVERLLEPVRDRGDDACIVRVFPRVRKGTRALVSRCPEGQAPFLPAPRSHRLSCHGVASTLAPWHSYYVAEFLYAFTAVRSTRFPSVRSNALNVN